jgi:aryl-alcohol dehydrogenase-like predicted oxidoreductase
MAEMPQRELGGLRVPAVGLGCNNFGRRVDLEGTRAVVDAAVDAGVNFLDTADVYGNQGGSEELLGQVLRGRRDEVVLATKFGMDMGENGPSVRPRGSAQYVREAVEASLSRLQADVIDLYQYHRPDGETPIEETLGALDELVKEGKVRHIGCSNFSAQELEEAAGAARENGLTSFVSLQNEYSLLEREIEADIAPLCEQLGVGILPYFPLASGLLTGKYARGQQAPEGTRLHGRPQVADDETFDRLEAAGRFAAAQGVKLLDVAIAGLAAQPMVASVIAGATRPEQVRANAAAVSRWRPGAAELEELDRIFPSPRRR